MQAVYIDKISLLHDAMTRCKLYILTRYLYYWYNLPQLDDVIEELPDNTSKSKKTLERESNKPMRSLMIAKDKNTGGIGTILQHDFCNNSALFDGDLMTKVNNKSQLISELENYLQELDYLHDLSVHQAVMVDVCCPINKNKQTKIPII